MPYRLLFPFKITNNTDTARTITRSSDLTIPISETTTIRVRLFNLFFYGFLVMIFVGAFPKPIHSEDIPLADRNLNKIQQNKSIIKILRIIDGDTIAIEAPWVPDPLKKEILVRVYGVDTPEKGWRGKCVLERMRGTLASKFTAALIKKSTKHEVGLLKWDKFGGRILGDFFFDDKSLRESLIENGFARPYFGKKKESWCPPEYLEANAII